MALICRECRSHDIEIITDTDALLHIAVDYIRSDVIIGCEAKINENILTAEVFPENYRKNTFRKDSPCQI